MSDVAAYEGKADSKAAILIGRWKHAELTGRPVPPKEQHALMIGVIAYCRLADMARAGQDTGEGRAA